MKFRLSYFKQNNEIALPLRTNEILLLFVKNQKEREKKGGDLSHVLEQIKTHKIDPSLPSQFSVAFQRLNYWLPPLVSPSPAEIESAAAVAVDGGLPMGV